jgi:hypothetical protein
MVKEGNYKQNEVMELGYVECLTWMMYYHERDRIREIKSRQKK